MHLTAHLAGQETFAQTTLVRFHGPALAQRLQPGQFVLARLLPTWDPYLRVPLFPVSIGHASWLAPLPQAHPTGARILAQAPAGTPVATWGPFGSAFPMPDRDANALIVTQTPSLPYVLGLLQRVSDRANTVLVVENVGPALPDTLHWLPEAVEYRVVPPAEAALEAALSTLIPWTDVLYAAGPRHWARFMGRQVENVRPLLEPGWAYALVVDGITCGLGLCDTCLLDTPRGQVRACRQGPVIDLGEWFSSQARGRRAR